MVSGAGACLRLRGVDRLKLISYRGAEKKGGTLGRGKTRDERLPSDVCQSAEDSGAGHT